MPSVSNAPRKLLTALLVAVGAIGLTGCGHYHHDRYNHGGYYENYGGHHDGYYSDKHRYSSTCDSYRCRDGYKGGGYDSYDDDYYGGSGYHRSKHRYGDRGYRDGHHGYRVCDSDGDRCYHSSTPYWDHRRYYRRHGYQWLND